MQVARGPAEQRRYIAAATRTRHEGDHGQTSDQAHRGRGDVWVLRYHGNEIEDGFNTIQSANADAKIGRWVTGEKVQGEDVVVWYGAHFTHDVAHQDPAEHGHVVGPDLVPVKWRA